jgi:hypothetical protein
MAYSPTLGRWAQTDPEGYVDSENLYLYVASNPVNHVDPFGLRVDAVYNRKKQTLTVRDSDTGATATVTGCFTGQTGYSPIPVGYYDILDHRQRTQGSATRDAGWYRLDPLDSQPGNDKRDDAGEGQGRTSFRLHPGRRSEGCITVPKSSSTAYDAVRKLIDNTKFGWASDQNDNGKPIKNFGMLLVIDDDLPSTDWSGR